MANAKERPNGIFIIVIGVAGIIFSMIFLADLMSLPKTNETSANIGLSCIVLCISAVATYMGICSRYDISNKLLDAMRKNKADS